jgi:radical SAM superfamily enzyme YgiQ (UPF0313 family)
MRVLFISANKEQINVLPLALGTGCVATAALKAGHEVKMIDLMFEENQNSTIRKTIKEFHPDIIGISIRNIDDQSREKPRFLLNQTKGVIDECRGLSNAPIILGGAGYSIFPKATLDYLGVEMGIQGEGEEAFPILLDRLINRSSLLGVPGLYHKNLGLLGKRAIIKKIDAFSLPLPNLWTLPLSKAGQIEIPVQTRRGCPLRCSYCSTPIIEGQIIRKRSPEFVVNWINEWVKTGFYHFFFVDNTFNLPPSYAKRLCQRLIDAHFNISWHCILYPKNVDKELVMLMAKAGCKEVSLGFESGCEKILKNMNKRFNPKEVVEISNTLVKYGISQIGFLLLGGPGETKETVKESLEFANALKLDSLKITVGIRIYPNTTLAKKAKVEGLIAPNDNLLYPQFYLTKELEGWLPEKIKNLKSSRANFII